MQGNDNILKSKKIMRDSLDLGFIQIRQPENNESSQESISGES